MDSPSQELPKDIPKSQRDLFARNLKHLPNSVRGAARRFLDSNPQYKPPSIPEEGLGVLFRHEGRLLHSLRDPFKQARSRIAGLAPNKQNRILVLGSGFLYDLEVLLATHKPKSARLLLITDSLGLFVACLFARDLGFLDIFEGRIHLLSPESTRPLPSQLPWESLLDLEEGTGILLLDNSSFYLPSGFVGGCKPVLRQALQAWFSDVFTQMYFEKTWLQHSLQNMYVLPRSLDLGELKDAFLGQSCAVVAAGPSLYNDVEGLKTLRSRLVLFATDSALRPLLLMGVVPDFVVALDSGYYNALDFHGLCSLGFGEAPFTLVVEPSIHPMVLRHFRGSVAFFRAKEKVAVLPSHPYSEAAEIEGEASSVANAAFNIALFMGFGTIHSWGLDLSFPFAESHCEGTIQKDHAYAHSSRTKPMSAQSFNLIAGRAELASGAKGVLTQQHFLRYKQQLEALIRGHAARTFTNHSSLGMSIEGMGRWEGGTSLGLRRSRPEGKPMAQLKPNSSTWKGKVAALEMSLCEAAKLAAAQLAQAPIDEWSPESDTTIPTILEGLPFLARGTHLLNTIGGHSGQAEAQRHLAFYKELSKLLRVLLAGLRTSKKRMELDQAP